MHRMVLLMVLMLSLVTPSARAFFDPPWITPASPTAGDVVSVNIQGGICDVFVEWPGYPQITRTGNTVRIVEYGNHETFEDFCNYGYWTVTESIGTFSSGDYTVMADFVYEDYPFGLTTVTLGVIPFSVAGASSTAAVPTSTAAGRIALLVLIGCIALRRLRVRRP